MMFIEMIPDNPVNWVSTEELKWRPVAFLATDTEVSKNLPRVY